MRGSRPTDIWRPTVLFKFHYQRGVQIELWRTSRLPQVLHPREWNPHQMEGGILRTPPPPPSLWSTPPTHPMFRQRIHGVENHHKKDPTNQRREDRPEELWQDQHVELTWPDHSRSVNHWSERRSWSLTSGKLMGRGGAGHWTIQKGQHRHSPLQKEIILWPPLSSKRVYGISTGVYKVTTFYLSPPLLR